MKIPLSHTKCLNSSLAHSSALRPAPFKHSFLQLPRLWPLQSVQACLSERFLWTLSNTWSWVSSYFDVSSARTRRRGVQEFSNSTIRICGMIAKHRAQIPRKRLSIGLKCEQVGQSLLSRGLDKTFVLLVRSDSFSVFVVWSRKSSISEMSRRFDPK